MDPPAAPVSSEAGVSSAGVSSRTISPDVAVSSGVASVEPVVSSAPPAAAKTIKRAISLMKEDIR